MVEEKFSINSNYIMVIILMTISVGLLGSYLDKNVAIFSMSFTFIIIGIVFLSIINRLENIRNAVDIFLIFFLFYLAYTTLIHFGLIEVYNTPYAFVESDEGLFYQGAEDIANKIKLGYSFSDISKLRDYLDLPGSMYFNAYIAKLAHLFGEHTFFTQKVAVTLISALIPAMMYSISRLYLSERTSIIVAIVYGVFSFVPYLSSLLLRDIHIALMYIITIYIILDRLSLINLIILFGISIASFYFREQTGIFMVGFTAIYFFNFINFTVPNNYVKLLIYLTLLGGLTLFVLNDSYIMDTFNQTFNSSAEHSAEQSSSGSMGAKIAKLPFGLNVVALFGFSQIQPFPPSLIFISKKGMFHFMYLLAGISWYFGWGFLIYGFLRNRVFLKRLDLKLSLMFLFAVVYLALVAVVEFNQRRQMAVYPIVYLLMVFSYLDMSITQRTIIWVRMLLFFLILVLTFNYMKL